jgi:simple sugar transport system permease protein
MTTTPDAADRAAAGVQPAEPGKGLWRRALAVAVTNSQTSGLAIFVVVVGATFTAINPSVYASPLNLQSMAYAVPEIGLLALAVCITMTSGGIDLSIVSTANLAALTLAAVATAPVLHGGVSVPIAMLAAIAVGLLCGLINGLLVAKVKIAPILATLATMELYRGIAIVITRGKPLSGLPQGFLRLGTLTIAIVPASFWTFLAVAAAIWFIINRTRFGLRLILVGAGAVAAEYSGIRRDRVLVKTYMLTGAVAGLAGVLMVAHSSYASAGYGSSYLLLAITIAVLGGTNPFGGRGPVLGVALAAIGLQMISSGFNMLLISPYLFQMAQGVTLVLVLILEGRKGDFTRLYGLVHPPSTRARITPSVHAGP